MKPLLVLVIKLIQRSQTPWPLLCHPQSIVSHPGSSWVTLDPAGVHRRDKKNARYPDVQTSRYLVVVSHTNVPDIHSLPPNCGSSIEWHSRLSFNIQVLGKTTHFAQQPQQINQYSGYVCIINLCI